MQTEAESHRAWQDSEAWGKHCPDGWDGTYCVSCVQSGGMLTANAEWPCAPVREHRAGLTHKTRLCRCQS